VDGYRFSTDVVVRFAETDAQGIAHHASFVVWLEVARVAYLAEHAGGYLSIRAQGIDHL
jgi:acyl-CoA thioester hydrolase